MAPKADEWRQAAAIPYRYRRGRVEVALITSSAGRRWIVPKGTIESGESAAECAVREAVEEAGVVGLLTDDFLGRYRYPKNGLRCSVAVYGLRVSEALDRWPEDGLRKRVWVRPREALRRIEQPGLNTIVARLVRDPDRYHSRRSLSSL